MNFRKRRLEIDLCGDPDRATISERANDFETLCSLIFGCEIGRDRVFPLGVRFQEQPVGSRMAMMTVSFGSFAATAALECGKNCRLLYRAERDNQGGDGSRRSKALRAFAIRAFSIIGGIVFFSHAVFDVVVDDEVELFVGEAVALGKQVFDF